MPLVHFEYNNVVWSESLTRLLQDPNTTSTHFIAQYFLCYSVGQSEFMQFLVMF